MQSQSSPATIFVLLVLLPEVDPDKPRRLLGTLKAKIREPQNIHAVGEAWRDHIRRTTCPNYFLQSVGEVFTEQELRKMMAEDVEVRDIRKDISADILVALGDGEHFRVPLAPQTQLTSAHAASA